MKGERSSGGPTPGGGRAWHRWHFADAVLDERSLELSVNGVDTELERKPLEALLFLLQHAGEVCTKDELLAGVWPGRVLSETVLTKCVGRLREALRDDNQEIIKTVYGFGYRFIAPVQVESVQVPEPSRFDFRPGDHLPGRPLWNLVERLGVGGHGEAWRVRHDKTGEQRVFKFALDETSLGALKREITLFRIINDTLGTSARVVRLLDWNLEQDPYFIEAEYVPGGNLIDWVQLRGGAAIPLEQRLEVVALLAEALAAVHSVGVLHKDLKPSNILVRPIGGHAIQVLLADFGSGGVLDDTYLEKLGITRLGFTKTVSVMSGVAGTPMYLAPEILAGQPFTVKADIYALGVILYQFVVGDFNRLMSPGWERDIADELLCEDIAALAEGNPAVRLGDAEQVARRLRSLPERREQLHAEREAQARAERSKRLLERARARRFGLVFAFAALIVGLATSTVLFLRAREAQELSERAAARSRAVTEFLSKDAFSAVSSGSQSVKNLRVAELLTRAGRQIDVRFANQPDVASELHYVIGRSLREFYQTGAAADHFNRALELGRELRGEGSEAALRSAAELVYIDYALGRLPKTIASHEATLAAGRSGLEPHNKAILSLREQLALGRYMLGDWRQSIRELESVLADATAAGIDDAMISGRAHFYLGQSQLALAQPASAEKHLHVAIELLTKAFGEQHREVSEARHALGRALTDSGRYEEARAQLDLSGRLAEQWEPELTWTIVRGRYFKALLFLEMDEPGNARPLLSEIVDFQDAHTGERPDLDHTGMVRQALAETYLRAADFQKAIDTLRKAVFVSERADGATHPQTRFIRLSLAEALLAAGPDVQSHESIARAVGENFPDLPAIHPFVAQLRRVKGLSALHAGDRAQARQHLQEAMKTYESLHGPRHWRTVRARAEWENSLRL
jgi:eukaryotic-like serine/threonine-protein kinase